MVKIVDRKAKWDKIVKQLSLLKKQPVVGVGYPESKVGHGIIEYAAANHNGTHSAGRNHSVTIPPRPFIAVTIDLNKEKIFNLKKKLGYLIMAGELTAEKSLKLIGTVVTGMIKKTISGEYFAQNVPNSEATLLSYWRKHQQGVQTKGEVLQNDRGGFGTGKKPLIDTGIMRNATTYEVFMNGKPND